MKTNYAIVARQRNTVFHACFFERQPTDVDVENISRELEKNPDHGLTLLTEGVNYELTVVCGEPLVTLKQILQIPDEV